MKSVGTMIAGMQKGVISYAHDAQGRVTERHRISGGFGEQVTLTTYNDHGDKASERETRVRMSADTGPWNLTEAGAVVPAGKPNPPQPPLSSERQYAYQYDQYGNWTEQTIVSRFQPDGAFQPGTVIRRKLTYSNVCVVDNRDYTQNAPGNGNQCYGLVSTVEFGYSWPPCWRSSFSQYQGAPCVSPTPEAYPFLSAALTSAPFTNSTSATSL